IERVMSQGVKPGNIIVNAVVAAPIGIKNVTKYPGVRVVAGAIDEKLDHRGYIVPGLGDFGDKYFAGYTEALVHDMADDLNFDHISRKKLANRFNRHISSEEA
ncbi:MAG: uracil phosphoribosyltransferase, partial [Actinomycetota bacterium]